MKDDLVQQIINEERERNEDVGAIVVRYAVIAEVLEDDSDLPSLHIVSSDNLTSYHAAMLAWALNQQANDAHIIDPD